MRKAGIRLAEKEQAATTAVFNNYLCNFHADATIAYLDHLRARAIMETAVKREEFMKDLASGDSLRFIRGDIAKSVWIESRLAAGLAHNERLAAEADYRNTSIALGYYMGNLADADKITIAGSLDKSATPLEALDSYIESAFANRADLTAALSNIEIAEAEKRLNSARRRIDLQLSLGAEYNKSEPSFTKLKVGASVPLKFSNLNRGARAMEKAKVEQAQHAASDTRLKIESEVMQAYSNCLTATRQAETFTKVMIKETAELLESKRKAYRIGEISFVEFIETERSDNMMQEAYINALYDCAVSRVELLRSIGTTATR